jgi:hypothetical protein
LGAPSGGIPCLPSGPGLKGMDGLIVNSLGAKIREGIGGEKISFLFKIK